MNVTEVRVLLSEGYSEAGGRLKAFCSVTFDDCFVVKDLKVIEGTKGLFVAMPSRKVADRCTHCTCKNHLLARFCNQCGMRLEDNRAQKCEAGGNTKLHADVAHPIHPATRNMIEEAVIKAYHDEVRKASQPGYVRRTAVELS